MTALERQRLVHIALPVEPHHLMLSAIRIPLLGRINGEPPHKQGGVRGEDHKDERDHDGEAK